MRSANSHPEPPSTYVLRFFVSPVGELHCRVTDVGSSESWVIADAGALQALLSTLQEQKESTSGD